MNAPAIKGWCPGVLSPMESGDGLIVRLKLTGGIVPLDLAGQIAQWSRRWGNGQIDLTGRANLQLRGVTSENLPDLQDAIAVAGLLDKDPSGEAVRNVIASPLAGLDSDAVLDIRPIVAELEARLAGDPALHKLPAKFCIAVDDSGRLGLVDVRADIGFEAVRTDNGPAFVVRLDGAADDRFGPIAPEGLVAVAAALAASFLTGRAKRMREHVARVGAINIAHDAALTAFHTSSLRGCAPQDCTVLSVTLAFGRIAAEELAHLVNCAAEIGVTELRLTPWRSILIPLPSICAVKILSAALAESGLILDPEDPRRRVAACVGAPACLNATTDVRGDAARLAALVDVGTLLHVSGCAKGCAHPRAATVTLTGRNGSYDLVHNGSPSDSPSLTGLTLDEAAAHLRQITADKTQGGTA